MIIETTHSIYEVRPDEKRFRRIHEIAGPPDVDFPVGRWHSFQRMGTPEVGEPVRFFWLIGKGQAGRMSHIGLCETSPVVRVLPDEPSVTAGSAGARWGRAASGN